MTAPKTDKKFELRTLHYAHIPIVPGTDLMERDVKDKVDAKVRAVLENYDEVSEDDDFRCMMLTEIGLVSENLEMIAAAAEEIGEWAAGEDDLRLIF